MWYQWTYYDYVVLWIKDIQAYVGVTGNFPYPIIADPERAIAKSLGMIDPDETDNLGMPLTCRAVSIEHSLPGFAAVSIWITVCMQM